VLRVLLQAVPEADRAAAVNSRGYAGESVLYWGAERGCLECVDLLVQNGAMVTLAKADGWTPLMVAAMWNHVPSATC
jgi:ankyrin repeat protein